MEIASPLNKTPRNYIISFPSLFPSLLHYEPNRALRYNLRQNTFYEFILRFNLTNDIDINLEKLRGLALHHCDLEIKPSVSRALGLLYITIQNVVWNFQEKKWVILYFPIFISNTFQINVAVVDFDWRMMNWPQNSPTTTCIWKAFKLQIWKV